MVKKAVILNIAFIVFQIIALAIREDRGFFVYYTVDSNLIALASSVLFIVFAIRGRFPRWLVMFRYLACSMLLVTFFVVILVLVPMAGSGALWLFHGSMFFQHLICPVLSLVSFAVFESRCVDDRDGLNVKDNILIVVPTLIYGTVMLILNALDAVSGPYPFLMVHEQSPLMTALWVVVIAALAYITGAGVRKWYNYGIRNVSGL